VASRAIQHIAVAACISAAAACGGGASSGAQPTAPTSSGPQTSTFSGTASTSATGGCSSPGHAISAGDGTISVSLLSTSPSSVKLQVCAPTAVNHALECTIPPFVVLSGAAPATASLRGGRAQTVTIFPVSCDANPPTAATITYTISVTYPG
jgi:hypothetical protein